MPKLFTIMGYLIFFWSNENNEPIHVHITPGTLHENATKISITRDAQCIIAHNKDRIPMSDLKKLLEVISAQFFMICSRWKEFFNVDTIKFIK